MDKPASIMNTNSATSATSAISNMDNLVGITVHTTENLANLANSADDPVITINDPAKAISSLVKNPENFSDAYQFAAQRYRVFHVQTPLLPYGHFRRQIYVDINPLPPTPLTGHKFEVMGALTSVFSDRPCRHPFASDARSKIRHIGWVLRDQFDAIKPTCLTVPLPGANQPHQCCHQWTEAAIIALRAVGVLEPLRASDNPATVFGPTAVQDHTF